MGLPALAWGAVKLFGWVTAGSALMKATEEDRADEVADIKREWNNSDGLEAAENVGGELIQWAGAATKPIRNIFSSADDFGDQIGNAINGKDTGNGFVDNAAGLISGKKGFTDIFMDSAGAIIDNPGKAAFAAPAGAWALSKLFGGANGGMSFSTLLTIGLGVFGGAHLLGGNNNEPPPVAQVNNTTPDFNPTPL